MLRRALFSAAIFFISALFVATFPSRVFAATTLGTHLAHFDKGAQVSVLKMIKSKVGNAAGYPVTVNIGVAWPASDIQDIANEAGGFSVMIRVTGISSETTSAQVAAFAQTMNGVIWNTTGKPVVILGNELNNLDAEWQDTSVTVQAAGQKYARDLWTSMAGLNRATYDTAAAPVDPYNPFNWKDFITGAKPAYTNGQAAAFNLYELSSADAATKMNEIRTFIGSAGPRNVITEFGPKDPKSPLNIYKLFYDGNPLPAGAQMGSVLLPNYCDTSKPVFGTFYWIDGKIYDINGKEIDPNNCSEVIVSYADESKNVDEEVSGVYVYEDIFGAMQRFGYDTPNGQKAGASKAMRYVMMCAPEFYIGAQVDGDDVPVYMKGIEDATQTLKDYCGNVDSWNTAEGTNDPNCLFDPVQANFTVLNSNISTPLYRKTSFNAQGKQQDSNRAESFETFFGLTTKLGRKTGDFVLQSVDKRLQSSQQYCAQTVNYLKAIDVLCKSDQAFTQNLKGSVEKPGGICALDNEFLNSQGVKKRYLDVLKQVRSLSQSHIPTERGLDPMYYCYLPQEEQDEQLMKDIAQVQPLTRNAFKIGYLIYYNTGRYKREFGLGIENLKKEPDGDAFWKGPDGAFSRYFHPIYRSFEDLFSKITFDVIPFLVPANVFSRQGHEELLGKSLEADQDYEQKADGVFNSPYFQSYQAVMPRSFIDKLVEQEGNRVAAVGGAMEFGASSKENSWNYYNDNSTDKRYVYCPICDPFNSYVGMQKVAPDKATRDMLPFAKVIWNRINAGIYAKEFTEYLQGEGKDNLRGAGMDPSARATMQVLPPPDMWSTCNVAPELVRGESANTLVSKGSITSGGTASGSAEGLWGTVKDSVTELNAIVRDPSAAREDKYAYYVQGFLLLPQEYGLLMKTELNFFRLFTSTQQQDNILIKEEKQQDFGSFLSKGPDPSQPGYDEIVPKFNRFLRINGQVFNLEDKTLSSTGRHGKEGSPSWYWTESCQEFQNRVGPERLAKGLGLPLCNDPERKHIEITAKLNSWDKGFNQGKADYRPILPGGWLARGIFEVMAHVLASRDSSNYQEEYCGLEDYWLGGNCGTPFQSGSIGISSSSNVKPQCAIETTPTDVKSQALIQLLEEAGSAYNVPAGVLLGVLRLEGYRPRSTPIVNTPDEGTADNPGILEMTAEGWGAQYVGDKQAALCAHGGADEVGPFQLKPSQWTIYGNAAQVDYPGRKTNPCNLRDAAYAAAQKLSHDRYGRYSEDPDYDNRLLVCHKENTGLPEDVQLNAEIEFGQFSSNLTMMSTTCSWNLADVVTATNHYNGACEGNYPLTAGPYKSYQQVVWETYSTTNGIPQ